MTSSIQGVEASGALARAPGRLGVGRPASRLLRDVDRRVTTAMFLAHGLGIADVVLLLVLVLPRPHGTPPPPTVPNLIALAVFLPLAALTGWVMGSRTARRNTRWLEEGRAPTAAEQVAVLRQPLACARTQLALWTGAAVLFYAVNVSTSGRLAFHVACTTFLGGLTTTAFAYLLVERLMRPISAAALATGPPPRPVGLGVQGRLLLAWLLATGVPLFGLAMVGLDGLTGHAAGHRFAVAVLVLSFCALASGLAATFFVARALAEPLTAVRRALGRVETGRLDAAVAVYDGSEIGLLQAGFNRMAGGLRERERLRTLLERSVGEEVARVAVDGPADPALGGEECDVAVIFVDLVGSTALASDRPAHEVVALLNRFFAIVVDVVGAHGGWVNKFEGDAALAVFGTPAAVPDSAACALAAARVLDHRLSRELPDATAAIGVSAGRVVAGWIGAERRFEFTVVGDPVNEAARLCELAKQGPGHVLAADRARRRAGGTEAARWRPGDQVTLRGRPGPTLVAAPR